MLNFARAHTLKIQREKSPQNVFEAGDVVVVVISQLNLLIIITRYVSKRKQNKTKTTNFFCKKKSIQRL